MAEWADLEFNYALFENASPAIMANATTMLENCYHNEGGGFSRFPGSKPFVQGLPGKRTYLFDFRNDLIAVTDTGQFFRVDKNGVAKNVTGVTLSGGKRPIFAQTEDQLVIAAGGPVLQLKSEATEKLSDNTPESTHVSFIDGFIVLTEKLSGRFYHNNPAGDYTAWNPIDVFTADAKPDDVNACIVTPYRELLLTGIDSVEQWERVQQANRVFSRRWTNGEGVFAPYTFVSNKTGNYGINKLREFVQFAAQVSRPTSDEINLSLEKIDDWTDAWADSINIKGQKFLLLQAPFATNPYGTQGQTLLLDYRKKRWARLYSWDSAANVPTRWRPWSYRPLWGRHFVGVEGGIEELDDRVFSDNGNIQRVAYQTAHIDKWTRSRIDQVELSFLRGVDPGSARDAVIEIRVDRDNRGFTRPLAKRVGLAGERNLTVRFGNLGVADSWQFQVVVTDPVPLEFRRGRVYVERIAR